MLVNSNKLLEVYPFNDITSGEGEGGCGSHGFPAKAGWDAVTGLGSPNYAKEKTLIYHIVFSGSLRPSWLFKRNRLELLFL